ncbi:MAG: L-ribulose-5-phosphate 4-epimerase AraD [Acidobacteriaceae bacterium]|nr:L-ribulose-5-phosphate 4-epimerase AraD [Acidobacteriaceae bacterium]MBV8570721.1 L-ribulose-5-phosphate 4-epimerase AraD [Acidobacteriaceae bacterium]
MQSLREEVLEANLELVRRGLVLFTFGNASGFDRASGLIVIKPSGVPYEQLAAGDMVITDLKGAIVEGKLRPSSDLATHQAIYAEFDGVQGVVHTHSRYATAWAQAGLDIPCLGTTHADYFHGPIPATRHMQPCEIEGEYEWNTGRVIIERFEDLDPLRVSAVLVAGHAPFCWGPTPTHAAHTAVIVEELAHMAFLTTTLRADVRGISDSLRNKHFSRKHGAKAYYGQINEPSG